MDIIKYCEVCKKESNPLTVLDGKWLCNTCLGANAPKLFSEIYILKKEAIIIQDKLHRRNMQIKELKKEIMVIKAQLHNYGIDDLQDLKRLTNR